MSREAEVGAACLGFRIMGLLLPIRNGMVCVVFVWCVCVCVCVVCGCVGMCVRESRDHKILENIGSNGNESACNAGDQSLIPESGRSPGEGNGNPLQ